MYNIKLEHFEGPLALLLQLIEKEEMEINQISLSEVTEQYLKSIEQIEQQEPEKLADFLVVASRLIYIKSKTLLPKLDLQIEDNSDDLEQQLKLYKKFIEATKLMEQRLADKTFSFSREKINTNLDKMFNPPKNIYLQDIKQIFEDVLGRLEPIIKLPEKSLKRAISIKQKINRLRDLINQKASTNFSELVEASQGRTEVILTFLGLLELVKQKFVVLDQDNLFEEIIIKKVC